MTIINKILFLSLSFTPIFTLSAQTPSIPIPSIPIKELKIGDTIPDLVIQNIINGDGTETKMSDLYKDGLLLIDFWATWCVPCLEQLIGMDTLKQQFPKKFKTVSVTYQDSATVQKFLLTSANRNIRTEKLIFSTNDTVLNKLFPHKVIPHNIWIDSLGVIRYITGHEDVNSVNINRFLSLRELEYTEQKVEIMGFDKSKPFDLGKDSYKFRSLLTGYVAGINGGEILDKNWDLKNTRLFRWNATITDFYAIGLRLLAPGGFDPLSRTHLIKLKTKDSIRFFYPTREYEYLLTGSGYRNLNEWKKENLYCYELIISKGVDDSTLSAYIFQDLGRVFNIDAKIEQMEIPCIMVSKVDSGKNLSPASLLESYGTLTFKGPKLIGQNLTGKEFFDKLYRIYPKNRLPISVSDEIANNNLKYDIELDFSETEQLKAGKGISLDMVTKLLSEYGFKFNVEPRLYPHLILSDIKE